MSFPTLAIDPSLPLRNTLPPVSPAHAAMAAGKDPRTADIDRSTPYYVYQIWDSYGVQVQQAILSLTMQGYRIALVDRYQLTTPGYADFVTIYVQ